MIESVVPPPFVLPVPTSVPPEATMQPLSIDEAVRISLVYQSTVASARGSLVTAQGHTEQARSQGLPQLSITAGYNNTTVTTTGQTGQNAVTAAGTAGTVTGYNAGAQLKQLLWDFNHTRDVIRQNMALEKAAQATLTVTRLNLVLSVKQAFYAALQSDATVKVNQSNLKNQQDHLALAQARFRAGVGLPSDVVQSQTAVASAVFNLTQACATSQTARVTLALQMGIDPRIPLVLAPASETVPDTSNPQMQFDLALRQRPEMVQALRTVDAGRYGVSSAASTDAPVLAGIASWSARGAGFPPQSPDIYTFGLSLSWPLFDSGYTSGTVRAARGTLESAAAQLEGTRQTIISDVATAFINLKAAEEHVVTARAEVISGNEAVRLNEGRYRAGLATILDLLDAQTALVQAQTDEVNAETALEVARASLAHAVGAPSP